MLRPLIIWLSAGLALEKPEDLAISLGTSDTVRETYELVIYHIKLFLLVLLVLVYQFSE